MREQIKLISVIVILIVLLLSGCQESSEDENNEASKFSNYTNQEKKFSIKYPSEWSKYENPAEIPDVDVLFVSPSNEPTKTGNLMITAIDNVSMTMDEFKDAHIENLSITVTDFNIASQKTTTLSDFPGYELIFNFTNDIYTWRQQEVWTINKNILYLLVHQSDREGYENFTSDIKNMVESFTILKSDDITNENEDNSDFNTFIGSWGDGTSSLITFHTDGSYASGNEGTFTFEEGKLVLTDIYDTVDRFNYVFSNNDETLTLTNLETQEETVLIKMDS